MRHKISQIFMFDLIFSVVILIVTLGVIFSYTISTTTNDDIYSLNLQILDSFTQTKVNSLNDERIREFFIDFQIRKLINIENTVAQQVVQFYYLNESDLAKNLSEYFVEPYMKNGYNFNLTLTTDSEVFELYSIQRSDDDTFENARLSSRLERSILGYVNRTDIYTGYVMRLDIWV